MSSPSHGEFGSYVHNFGSTDGQPRDNDFVTWAYSKWEGAQFYIKVLNKILQELKLQYLHWKSIVGPATNHVFLKIFWEDTLVCNTAQVAYFLNMFI